MNENHASEPMLITEQTIRKLIAALEFCRDIAEEELPYNPPGTGAEVALRHVARRAREALGYDD